MGRLGPNVDAQAQVQAIRGKDEAFGGRIEGLLDVALTPNTRARLRGWGFKGEGTSESGMGEVILAQGFGMRTAVHVAYRVFQSRGDTDTSDEIGGSILAGISLGLGSIGAFGELRYNVVKTRVADSFDVNADGFSINLGVHF